MIYRFSPRGVLPNKGFGGLDLISSLEAKFGARSGQVHKIRGKIWEVLSPNDAKVGKSPNFGVTSEIQRAKFGVFVIYIFGGKVYRFSRNFFPRRKPVCVADSGREILKQVDTTGNNGSRF